MYRVAVLVNENELSHSAFADTVALCKRPGKLGPQKARSYSFTTFDRYNIGRLLDRGSHDALDRFDAVIVATNATNNPEVLATLRALKPEIDSFLARGAGLLVLGQKKLANQPATGFMPARLEYALKNRPEASSAEGQVSITDPEERVVSYPNSINNQLLEYRCSHNNFAEHRYRSTIEPVHASQYVAVVADLHTMPPVSKMLPYGNGRPLVLRSSDPRDRVVVSSMVLDWAGHEELVENLLTFIAEGAEQVAVVRAPSSGPDRLMTGYLVRARASKIPVREYDSIASIDNVSDYSTVILSPGYSSLQFEQIWRELASVIRPNLSLYHLRSESEGPLDLLQRSRGGSVPSHIAETIAWLTSEFSTSLWGKSVWTYRYVLDLFCEAGVDHSTFLQPIFDEIVTHSRPVAGQIGSYDNVPNASTQMLRVLDHHCVGRTCWREPDPAASVALDDLVDWLLNKLNNTEAIAPRDQLYMALGLLHWSGMPDLEEERRQVLDKMATTLLKDYRARGFANLSTIELTQILELVCRLWTSGRITPLVASEDIGAIGSIVDDRQSVSGEWRNVSETAEVSMELGSLLLRFPNVAGSDKLFETIQRGAESLLEHFKGSAPHASTDVNLAAKASYALLVFDRLCQSPVDDYFQVVGSSAQSQRTQTEMARSLESSQGLVQALLTSEANARAASDQLESLAIRERKLLRRVGRLRAVAVAAVTFAVVLVAVLLGLVAILWTQHRSTANALFGSWDQHLMSAFIALGVTALASITYSTLTRTRPDRED